MIPPRKKTLRPRTKNGEKGANNRGRPEKVPPKKKNKTKALDHGPLKQKQAEKKKWTRNRKRIEEQLLHRRGKCRGSRHLMQARRAERLQDGYNTDTCRSRKNTSKDRGVSSAEGQGEDTT